MVDTRLNVEIIFDHIFNCVTKLKGRSGYPAASKSVREISEFVNLSKFGKVSEFVNFRFYEFVNLGPFFTKMSIGKRKHRQESHFTFAS